MFSTFFLAVLYNHRACKYFYLVVSGVGFSRNSGLVAGFLRTAKGDKSGGVLG